MSVSSGDQNRRPSSDVGSGLRSSCDKIEYFKKTLPANVNAYSLGCKIGLLTVQLLLVMNMFILVQSKNI